MNDCEGMLVILGGLADNSIKCIQLQHSRVIISGNNSD